MMRYERNKHYLDQIHYAEGNLLIAKGDTAGAVKAYSDAVNKSVRQGIDMAIANIALGEIYFTLGDYDKAQPCYSSSVTMLGEDFPNLKTIQLRSDVLDELAVHSRNVHMQDSLLRLADMSEPERLAAINRIIDELKNARKRSAKKRNACFAKRKNTPPALQHSPAALPRHRHLSHSTPTTHGISITVTS